MTQPVYAHCTLSMHFPIAVYVNTVCAHYYDAGVKELGQS